MSLGSEGDSRWMRMRDIRIVIVIVIAWTLALSLGSCGSQEDIKGRMVESMSKIETYNFTMELNATVDLNMSIASRDANETKRMKSKIPIRSSGEGSVNLTSRAMMMLINTTGQEGGPVPTYIMNDTIYVKGDEGWRKMPIQSPDDFWGRQNATARRAELLGPTKISSEGSERIEGVDCLKLKVVPDPGREGAVLAGQVGPFLPITSANLTEIINKMSNGSKVNMTFWVAKEDYLYRKMQISANFNLAGEAIKLMQLGRETDQILIGTRVNLTFRDYDEKISIVLPEEARYATVQLIGPTPTGNITGLVLGRDSKKPVMGAWVSGGGRGAYPDYEGRYTLERVPAGLTMVRAAPSWGYEYEGQNATVEVVKNETVWLNFSLSPLPAGNVTGIVVDASSKRPIKGAGVSSTGRDQSTSEDGTYTLTRVPAGLRQVFVGKSTRAGEEGYEGQNKTVEVAANKTVWLNFSLSLKPRGNLTGLVLDSKTNKPVAKARVLIERNWWTSKSTDAEGRYSFANLKPGLKNITVQVKDYKYETRAAEVVADKTTELDFSLAPLNATDIVYFDWGGSDSDQVGAGDSGSPDGKGDGQFNLGIHLASPTEVKSIALYKAGQDGKPAGGVAWHSADSRYDILGVFSEGRQINQHHVQFLGNFSGDPKFVLYASGSGEFKAKDKFLVRVELGDGTMLESLGTVEKAP